MTNIKNLGCMYHDFLQTIFKEGRKEKERGYCFLLYDQLLISETPFLPSPQEPKGIKSSFRISTNDAFSLYKHLLTTYYGTRKDE